MEPASSRLKADRGASKGSRGNDQHTRIRRQDRASRTRSTAPARRQSALSASRDNSPAQARQVENVAPYIQYPPLLWVGSGRSGLPKAVDCGSCCLPTVLDAQYIDSLFEVRTVLLKSERDDGRPILFERHPGLPGCYSILGGMIDHIYDVLGKLDEEIL